MTCTPTIQVLMVYVLLYVCKLCIIITIIKPCWRWQEIFPIFLLAICWRLSTLCLLLALVFPVVWVIVTIQRTNTRTHTCEGLNDTHTRSDNHYRPSPPPASRHLKGFCRERERQIHALFIARPHAFFLIFLLLFFSPEKRRSASENLIKRNFLLANELPVLKWWKQENR